MFNQQGFIVISTTVFEEAPTSLPLRPVLEKNRTDLVRPVRRSVRHIPRDEVWVYLRRRRDASTQPIAPSPSNARLPGSGMTCPSRKFRTLVVPPPEISSN